MFFLRECLEIPIFFFFDKKFAVRTVFTLYVRGFVDIERLVSMCSIVYIFSPKKSLLDHAYLHRCVWDGGRVGWVGGGVAGDGWGGGQ